MKQKFTAPRFGATVVIFEPSQKAEQPEEIIETFEVGPYEEIEYDFPSNTASYRYENLHSRDDAGERPAAPPDQEAKESTPDYSAELQRGSEAHDENMRLAKKYGVPTEPIDEKESFREYVKEKEENKRAQREKVAKKAIARKASAAKGGNGRRKKRTGPPAGPEENEGEQIAAAKNPMTNPDLEMRGTTGKKPEEQHDAAGRKAGDQTNAEDAKQQRRSRS
jgi:hypothetical protein